MALSLESLIAEGRNELAKQAQDRRLRKAKPLTVEDLAVGPQIDPNTATPNLWQTVGLRYVLIIQTCLQCAASERISGGLYSEQRNGDSYSRRVLRDTFTEEDLDKFEPQLEEVRQNIPMCYSCLLIDRLIRKCDHRQLSLPFTPMQDLLS